MEKNNTNNNQPDGDTLQSPKVEPEASNPVDPTPAKNPDSDSDSTEPQENIDSTDTPNADTHTPSDDNTQSVTSKP